MIKDRRAAEENPLAFGPKKSPAAIPKSTPSTGMGRGSALKNGSMMLLDTARSAAAVCRISSAHRTGQGIDAPSCCETEEVL